MKLKSLLVSLLIVFSSAFFGCGFGISFGQNSLPEPEAIEALQIYAARASFSSKDFEQYSLVGDDLYVECGEIFQGENANAEQHYFSIEKEERELLETQIAYLRSAALTSLPEPGNVSSMFDEGQFVLAARQKSPLKIETTFDAITNRNTKAGRSLYELYSVLRSIPDNPPCGRKSFYGVGVIIEE